MIPFLQQNATPFNNQLKVIHLTFPRIRVVLLLSKGQGLTGHSGTLIPKHEFCLRVQHQQTSGFKKILVKVDKVSVCSGANH